MSFPSAQTRVGVPQNLGSGSPGTVLEPYCSNCCRLVVHRYEFQSQSLRLHLLQLKNLHKFPVKNGHKV